MTKNSFNDIKKSTNFIKIVQYVIVNYYFFKSFIQRVFLLLFYFSINVRDMGTKLLLFKQMNKNPLLIIFQIKIIKVLNY